MELLRTSGLCKRYAGKQALDGVDMALAPGKIMGLLGPNGSGKTTLMKVIAGLITADRGEVYYPGGAIKGIESKKVISFLPDDTAFPSWMKVSDAFGYFRDMYPDYDQDKAAQMQQLLELTPGDAVKKLSKGMRERLALALAFSRRAPLYLLDEPLGGIDPVGKLKVMQSIISTHRENSTILISTHLVRDVEAIFDSVLFIREGKIVFQGECEDMRAKSGKTVEQMYLEVFLGV